MGRSIRAKLLNGERLVADDITSNHYRGIDRKIPMEKVLEWPASVTCRRLVMMQQSYNAGQCLAMPAAPVCTIEASAQPSPEEARRAGQAEQLAVLWWLVMDDSLTIS